MPHQLADVLEWVLPFLDSRSFFALLSSGNGRLHDITSRSKRAAYHGGSYSPLHWPSKVNRESKLTELEVVLVFNDLMLGPIVLPPYEPPYLPRTLTSLTLAFATSFNAYQHWPFGVVYLDGATKKLEQLSSMLPFLLTLKTAVSFQTKRYTVLPPSLTRYHSTYGLFSPQIPFPPQLRHFNAPLLSSESFIFPLSTEVIVSQFDPHQYGGELPNLHTLSTTSFFVNDWGRFPALTALEMNISRMNFSTCPSLTYLCIVGRDQPLTYNELPRSLARITQRRFIGDFLLYHQIDPQFVHLLPPALTDLVLDYHQTCTIPRNLYSLLPKGLTRLDMNGSRLMPKGKIIGLPPTLTSLGTRGINVHNVDQLRFLPNLRELKLRGGHITVKLALKLPRNLDSLHLIGVALPTKGLCVLPGNTESSRLSVLQPDTRPLRGTLAPLLRTLVIVPGRVQTYWWTHAYDILIELPTSLQNLSLYFFLRAMSIHPAIPNLIDPFLVPSSGKKLRKLEIKGCAPSISYSRAEQSTPLFERLSNLQQLHLTCSVLPADVGYFARRLPRGLLVYGGPAVQPQEIDFLPKSLVRISPASFRTLKENERHELAHLLPAYTLPYAMYADRDPMQGFNLATQAWQLTPLT